MDEIDEQQKPIQEEGAPVVAPEEDEMEEQEEELETQAAVAVADDQVVMEQEQSAVMSQLNLESLINRYIKDIETMQDKVKAHKTMLDDAFNNDAEYAQAQQKVKEATKAKKGIKEKIEKQPVIQKLNEEVTALKEELLDLRSGLSQYLQQYQAQTGMSQFTSESGEILEIVTVRKLVRRASGKS